MFTSIENIHRACGRVGLADYETNQIETDRIAEETGEWIWSMLRIMPRRLNGMTFMLVGYLAMKMKPTMLITHRRCLKAWSW